MKLNSVKFQFIKEEDKYGIIHVFDPKKIPFKVKRVFTVSSKEGIERGYHAHIKCNQLMLCLSGEIKLTLDDGINRKSIILIPDGKSILVPNKVWAEQLYIKNDSLLLTFCDQLYDENDYLRSYKDFKKFLNK